MRTEIITKLRLINIANFVSVLFACLCYSPVSARAIYSETFFPNTAKPYSSHFRNNSLQTQSKLAHKGTFKSFKPLCVQLRGGEIDDNTKKIDIEATNKLIPLAMIQKFGEFYAKKLDDFPILTKSVTAGAIFGLSDWSAQLLEHRYMKKKNEDGKDSAKIGSALAWDRIVCASLVGLLYFGPAAHAWYDIIFYYFPETSIISTLQKAILGQFIFGPSFTCIFFATSLILSDTFTLRNWAHKIKKDLPGAWLAGLGYWPVIDFISYSLISPKWIPLFINFCSFIWTIYLSFVSFR